VVATLGADANGERIARAVHQARVAAISASISAATGAATGVTTGVTTGVPQAGAAGTTG
jgi:hypothetical protein